jgi:hypothetical protein
MNKVSFSRLPVLWILILCSLFFTSLAQQPAFNASVSKNKVAVGEQFQLSFSLNQAGGNFRPPDLSDFHVLSGPSTSTSMQFINGVMSQSYTYYYVLAAKKEGRFSIGPASVQSNGKKLESKAMNIEVVKAAASPKSNNRDQNSAYPQDISSNIFLKAYVSRSKVFVGEALKVSFKIYTRVSLVNITSQKLPSFDGFWSEEIPLANKNIQLYEEVLDGIAYNVGDLGSYLLIPQRAGSLEVGAMEMDWVIRVQGRSRSNSLFEQFFGGGYQDMKISLASNPISVNVEPLPKAGKPASFSGAVGEFNITSKINRQNLKKDESANLLITLTGKGNLKFIEPPAPELADGLESYDPKITQKYSVESDGISGQRSFDYLIIPRRGGEFLIPQQEFSYFNPAEKQYKTLRLNEVKITAEGGASAEANVVSSSPKSELRQLGKDLAFIQTSDKGFDLSSGFVDKIWFWIILLSFPLAASFYTLIWLKKNAEKSDLKAWKRKTASKTALEKLKQAEKFVAASNPEFFSALEKGLSDYLSDKFGIPRAEFSAETLEQKMKLLTLPEVHKQEALALLEVLQMARYAPSSVGSTSKSLLEQARSIIQKLEENYI